MATKFGFAIKHAVVVNNGNNLKLGTEDIKACKKVEGAVRKLIIDAKQLGLNITVNVSSVNGFITTMSDPSRLDAIVLETHSSVNFKTQFDSASKTAKKIVNTLNTSGSQKG